MKGLADKIHELDEALTRSGFRHAFGGALALAYCIGEPRGTADIDIDVFAEPTEARRVFESLPDEVLWSDSDVENVESSGQVRLLWDETPIDLFFSVHDLQAAAAARTRHVPFDDQMIPVLDCSDLAVFKTCFGRTRDWADIEAMVEVATLDADYVLEWATELLGVESPNVKRLVRAFDSRGEEGSPNPFS